MAEPDERPDDEAEPTPPAPAPPPGATTPPVVDAPKRTPAFRKRLLARLSQLGYATHAVKDSAAIS